MGGKRIALIISNEDLNEIVKVIKSLDNSGVMIDGVSQTVKNEIKKWILGMLLGTSKASILRKMLKHWKVLLIKRKWNINCYIVLIIFL